MTVCRSSDDENVIRNTAETGVELRRERGRSDRLRSEMKEVTKKLDMSTSSLEKCRKELKRKQEMITKLELQYHQTEGENEEQREMLKQVNIEKAVNCMIACAQIDVL